MKPTVVYCDHLAHIIKQALEQERGTEPSVQYVGPIQFDLDSNGAMATTTKTILVRDMNGTDYTITIEERVNTQKKALQQQTQEHDIKMLRHELLSCETALQQERSLRANA